MNEKLDSEGGLTEGMDPNEEFQSRRRRLIMKDWGGAEDARVNGNVLEPEEDCRPGPL